VWYAPGRNHADKILRRAGGRERTHQALSERSPSTSIGIAPEDQEEVFEEFLQVGTAAEKVEGTGLGLTLCLKFVELHGGRIWVKSQVGVGSTFTFTIPACGSE
jgi:signal transduction histidine kinase